MPRKEFNIKGSICRELTLTERLQMAGIRDIRAGLKVEALGTMQDWPIDDVANYYLMAGPTVQAAEARLIAYAKSKGGYSWHLQMVDGKPVSGTFADERKTGFETFNPERMAAAFMAYHNLSNSSAQDLLAQIFQMLKPAQRNKLMLQGENSAGDNEPLMERVRKYAEKHMNEDGQLLEWYEGKPSWDIRQSPPSSEIVVEAAHDSDDEPISTLAEAARRALASSKQQEGGDE